MATIPNRYYNSPWIADAARNLASALAPPDVEKQLAHKQAQFDYEHSQSEAAYTTAERGRTAEADKFLGQLEGMQYVMKEDGTVDIEATHQQARKLGDAVLRHGGREYYTAVDKAMGTASPKHAAEQAMIKAKADEFIRRDNNRGEININLQEVKEKGLNSRNTEDNQTRLQVGRERNAANRSLAVERAKARQGSRSTKILPDATMNALIDLLDGFEADSGALMTLDDYNGVLDIAIDNTLATGNPVGAMISALEETNPVVDNVQDNGMWANAFRSLGAYDSKSPVLKPTFKTRAPAAETQVSDPRETDTAPAPDEKPKPKPTGTAAPKKKPTKPIESFGR